jgi:hypothetical protein
MKNLQKKITEFLPASSTKNLCQNFSILQEKIVCFKFPCIYRKQDFSLFLLMVGLNPGLNLQQFENCLDPNKQKIYIKHFEESADNNN